MREIKFRAWNEKKSMIFSPDLNDHDGAVRWFHILEDEFYDGETVLMQFTGLKDKNGKEFYEGDVLEFTDIEGSIGDRVEVEYDFKKLASLAARIPLWQKVEVIGNIYENKDLLV